MQQHLGGASISEAWCSGKHSTNTSTDSQEPAQGSPAPHWVWLAQQVTATLARTHMYLALGLSVPIPRAASCVSFTLVTTAGMHKHLQHARDIAFRSGGVRSSVSGWEYAVLLTLQRQEGQEKKLYMQLFFSQMKQEIKQHKPVQSQWKVLHGSEAAGPCWHTSGRSHSCLSSLWSSPKTPSPLATLTISQLSPAGNRSLAHEVSPTHFRLA